MNRALPWWFTALILPIANIALALFACAMMLWLMGINVISAAQIMFDGAFGNAEGISYTLYYATNFIFSGLGVALAWKAGLFNIGGEGQAMMGGLGITIICLYAGELSMILLFPLTIVISALFGALWAFIPGILNAYRGSHIVITTVMFNLIASSLLVYLLVGPLKEPNQMAAVSPVLTQSSWLPTLTQLGARWGFDIPASPLNLSFIWALMCCGLVYIYLWHTRLGYETRVIGFSASSAEYAGISRQKIILLTMMISGALAGFIGLNEVQGSSHQLHVEFVSGFGFAGIAIALIGRNHPLGIIVASLLFGGLYQGGAELAFSLDNVGNDIIVLIQALVVLFCGALEWMLKPSLIELFGLNNQSNNAVTAEVRTHGS